ncbi:ABC transporter related protein [Desulfarculus baarsii DSM 2075]|uniref:ABC transporter related protein n=1 Tax=Desulfarculus baarsii (strain ATCC 33931 / DSM 2075 / LMG 7858 / VKM B-1802 / 2st14) TaxID=644282 RepID=E1QGJ1_DESB2|nr:ABC transporter ATP-binding protein [Desulfarculus baarsii]ADK84684.1 ABC transporter related protein [Desulfarculus baarsii DSM 2075]
MKLLADKLSFRYAGGAGWALKDASLSLDHGQCVILAGPSGCGKSTLLKAFNGLIPHYEKGRRAGRVLLDGVDLAAMAMHQIARRVGAVFQNPRSQFFTTRVEDEIAFGCENLGTPRPLLRRKVDLAMSRLGLEGLGRRSVFGLSAGQRQKVILAAVLAMGVDALTLDEPSANLDQAALAELVGLLAELKAEGKTIVIAEHRCDYLRGLADRVVLLDDGRISAEIDAKAFFGQSAQEARRLGLRWPGDATPSDDPPASGGHDLALCALRYRHPGRPGDILRGVDLEAHGGRIVAVSGANGCGKTTLALTIAGLLKERGGAVRLDGRPCRPRQRLRRCRMVLQEADHQLFAESVQAELTMAGGAGQKTRVAELLRASGLERVAQCRPQALSGGQKQRLAVAAALAAQPDVLVLDEPTSGLDGHNLRGMAALLCQAAQAGTIVLAVTIDHQFIDACHARALCLEDGRILAQKPSQPSSTPRQGD